jgi:hypothetical protein
MDVVVFLDHGFMVGIYCDLPINGGGIVDLERRIQ